MTDPLRILVTAGTGQTGSRVAALVSAAGAHARIAARHAPAPDAPGEYVRFDWHDPATYARAVEGVDRMYLVPPPLDADPAPLVEALQKAARAAGVRRAVLLNSSAFPASARGLHRVRDVVREMPEWSVLLPTGFMENFIGAHPTAAGIRATGEIVTSTGDGRMAFISVADVAGAAAAVLLADRPTNADHVLTGPEALGYADVARAISSATGRPVRHVPVPPDERRRVMAAAGVPAAFVETLLGADELVRRGAEDRVTGEVRDLTGRPPIAFEQFVGDHRAEWS